ncbi:aspartate/glutamate racemase family protein [Variovorax sp. OV329]|uniref:aspartate/glutamate racemase family protein n=1 Tax=Variovorax sp. OV329 TaxID=1882825 RepID=UPI0008F1D266|nr:aspartate/glutamate racemase family protein [Variovorax sp. OV329]SFN19533.1 hypothetical protein SAMN05444747_117114 [Variovorax sp. OV329]
MTPPASPPRIALIHALVHSMAPINQAFERLWPQARRMHLLDDSLSGDLALRGGGLDEAMHQRFATLGNYAVACGADAILFTCSAFGPCIEAVAAQHPDMPVLKPNEAMIDEAAKSGRRIGLLASFAPTLTSMPPEFPAGVSLDVQLAGDAMAALNAGDVGAHDAAALAGAQALVERGAEVIALAQFSLARAAPLLRERLAVPVLTTVDSGVLRLRRRFDPDASVP